MRRRFWWSTHHPLSITQHTSKGEEYPDHRGRVIRLLSFVYSFSEPAQNRQKACGRHLWPPRKWLKTGIPTDCDVRSDARIDPMMPYLTPDIFESEGLTNRYFRSALRAEKFFPIREILTQVKQWRDMFFCPLTLKKSFSLSAVTICIYVQNRKELKQKIQIDFSMV